MVIPCTGGGDLPSTSDLETAGQDTPRVGSQFSSTGSFMEASTTSTEISDGITNLPSRSASPPDQDGKAKACVDHWDRQV